MSVGKGMYSIKKVLNHNTVIAVSRETGQECMIMGKGIGFGKKPYDETEPGVNDSIYSLQESTERGSAKEMAESLSPVCMEIAGEILDEAERVFDKIDRSILFPMADHIEYAVKRIRNKEQISNPLTEDIRVLFHMEYKVAMCVEPILKKRLGVQIDEHEVGYIALHIHAAIGDEKISQTMQMARAVRESVSLVEAELGRTIDVMSLSYNRLMNHIRYMVARVANDEILKVNLNDYMKVKFPQAYEMAETICKKIEKNLKCTLNEVEIGYLAMHIERVKSGELEPEFQEKS